MYNVEEAYMATVKTSGEQFKKIFKDTEKAIQDAIKEGRFETQIDYNIYPVDDIDRLQDFLIFLGYAVERTEFTNGISRLNIQWTETEFKNYLDKE